ncbi:MAG: RluA family pseudouridine synthase [Dehalococcoidia bacterium]|nr:RluA family pseudouridine synthase [Dehalococcoidia bacterium]
MAQRLSLTVSAAALRLDQFLAAQVAGLTRSRAQALIRSGLATRNGRPAKASQPLAPGDRVELTVPDPEPTRLRPQPIPLEVLFEDADLLVINKPPGLVVHPAPGHPDATLVNAILARCPDIVIGGSLRPGLVHRLDKDTSGLIVVAKNDAALVALQAQFKGRQVEKSYLALVTGVPARDAFAVDAPIARHPVHRRRMAIVLGGREARTEFRVVRRLREAALVECRPRTGRTHQIRVHLASAGHAVLGDLTYGTSSPLIGRQALHAWRLRLQLPGSGVEREFEAPLPADFQQALDALN